MNYNSIKKCIQQILIGTLLVFSIKIYGQSINMNVESNNQKTVTTNFQNKDEKLGRVIYFSSTFKKVKGSIYLFKDWQQKAMLYTLDNQEVLINSINLNVPSNYFESKIYKDSVLQFNFDKFQKVLVNGKTYKQFEFNGSSKIFELIYESDNFVLLKGFNIQLIYGSPNPMLNSPNDRYLQRHSYYLKKGKSIQPFKPTRKRLINLFNGNETRAAILESHIKKDKLLKKESIGNSEEQLKHKFIEKVDNIGVSVYESSENNFKGSKKIVKGTKYLFNDWNNRGFLYTSKGEKIALNNMNLNLQGNVFVTRIANSAVYTFSFNNLEKVIIRNKTYRKYYYNGSKSVFEVVHETDAFSLLKRHTVEFVPGSPNPMLNKKDKYIRKFSYFVKLGNKMKPFKLKKKSILELVRANEVKIAEIDTFVASNNLSFKNESDVKRILEFCKH